MATNKKMGKDLTSPADIFKLEQDAMGKLNAFNQAYANYMRCGDTGNVNQIALDTTACTEPDVTTYKTNVDSAYKKLSEQLSKLNNALNKMGASKGKTPVQYDASYNAMMVSYDHLVQTRQKIDDELAELYGTSNSVNSFYSKMYMSTMYSKILWTILATSLVYYTIMTLRRK